MQGSLYALKDVWRPRDHVPADITLTRTETFIPTYVDPLDEPDDPSQTYPRLQDCVYSRGPSRPTLSLSGMKRKLSEVAPLGITDGGGKPKRIKTADYRHHNQHPHEYKRIFFMDIGVPVHDLRNYSDVWTALEGGSEALHALHLGRLVHRDISSANILLVDDGTGKRGVLMDLEYVKKVDNDSPPMM